jgi:hypothetical protein
MTLPADLSPVERQHLRAQAEALNGKIQLAISAVRCDSSIPTGSYADAIESALLAQRLQGRTEGGPAWRPQIEQLIERWREKGNQMCPAIPRGQLPHDGWTQQQYYDRLVGVLLLRCADDLAAVLCALPASPSVSSSTAQTDQDT